MNFDNLDLQRFTVHKIYGKSAINPEPYADACTDFCRLGTDGNDTLYKRLTTALKHKTKLFELDLAESGKDSFFQIQRHLFDSKKPSFLKASQLVADKLADAHVRTKIPDGLLLLVEAKLDSHNCIITVKAEKSDAFAATKNTLKLIKDIFLSSDKTLYKVGFFVKMDSKNSSPKAYRYFVYDDAFTPANDDLAFYFYNKFLGLSTEANSKLQTNRLHKHLTEFASTHVSLSDRFEVMRVIDRMFMDANRKTLNIGDFKGIFPAELSQLFDSTIAPEFTNAIIKDNAVVNGLKTKRISLSASTTVLLKSRPEGIIMGNTRNYENKEQVQLVLDSGRSYNYVMIPTLSNDRPVEELKQHS